MDFKKILVSINGTEADEEAIRLACRLARGNKGKVYVTYVIELERSFPLDAEVGPKIEKGEQALDTAEKIAEDYDFEVQTDLLQARETGPALVNEAIERRIDLIIIGLVYKTRFGEFRLGDIVPYVLKNAPCRVMISREPISSGVNAGR